MCVPPAEKKKTTSSTDEDSSLQQESLALWLSKIIARLVLAPLVLVSPKIGDRIIWGVLGRDYIYNVSWEDPRVDRRELNLSEKDHVVTLASAGETLRVSFGLSVRQPICSKSGNA